MRTKVYRVNDLFYSLQGEGHNTGRTAVFVRFAGCNLRCPFCDTAFDSYRPMSADDIVTAIKALLPPSTIRHSSSTIHHPPTLVVLTGGEPTLQVDEPLVDELHQQGFEVAMESNGTRPAARNLDWLTVSPKGQWTVDGGWWTENIWRVNELKIVFDEHTDPAAFLHPLSTMPPSPSTIHHPLPPKKQPLLYLQPCDTGDAGRNARITKKCIDYIKAHPEWRLSLQVHKLAGFK